MNDRLRRICVVSGSRADYGYLWSSMREIRDDDSLELQLIVTGSHLSPEFGLSYQAIEADGFSIDAKIDMLLSGDSPAATAKSTALGIIGFGDAFACLEPDFVMLLGDRFEILAAAVAALVARIPIAHIAGGDTTEGAFDEAIRHSITKMSHLHFVTNEVAATRVRQLGENPSHIYDFGSPAIDHLNSIELLNRGEFETETNFRLRDRNVLVTYHPVTLTAQPPEEAFREVLAALDGLGPDVGILFTAPNADTRGRALFPMIEEFTLDHDNASFVVSLGQRLYYSAIALVDATVGNSSSGLYEAPSLGTATVNVGDRQKGRLKAASVINCRAEADEILSAIGRAFEIDCSNVVNPYGGGNSGSRIVQAIKEVSHPNDLIMKHFFDLPEG